MCCEATYTPLSFAQVTSDEAVVPKEEVKPDLVEQDVQPLAQWDCLVKGTAECCFSLFLQQRKATAAAPRRCQPQPSSYGNSHLVPNS